MSIQRFQPNHSQTNRPFMISPANITEAMEYSKMIAASLFCPATMKNKPGDVMVAIQMGAEIGLSPLQALQNIAVINGKPCVYGDAALAVVIASSHYVSHREWFEGSVEKGNLIAYCGIIRRNSDEYVKSFSMQDAQKAGLWTKAGVWQQYPSRMLQMRARAFAIRDKFADALRGINIREEVEDYKIEAKFIPAPRKEKVQKAIESAEVVVPPVDENEIDILFMDYMAKIEGAETEDALKKVFGECKKVDWKETDYLKKLIDAKDVRKASITTKDFLEGFDGETGEVVS